MDKLSSPFLPPYVGRGKELLNSFGVVVAVCIDEGTATCLALALNRYAEREVTPWRRSMFENMKALADEIVQDNGDPPGNNYQRGYMDACAEAAKRIREIIAEAVADNDIATVF
jgi:hypothetical protein